MTPRYIVEQYMTLCTMLSNTTDRIGNIIKEIIKNYIPDINYFIRAGTWLYVTSTSRKVQADNTLNLCDAIDEVLYKLGSPLIVRSDKRPVYITEEEHANIQSQLIQTFSTTHKDILQKYAQIRNVLHELTTRIMYILTYMFRDMMPDLQVHRVDNHSILFMTDSRSQIAPTVPLKSNTLLEFAVEDAFKDLGLFIHINKLLVTQLSYDDVREVKHRIYEVFA